MVAMRPMIACWAMLYLAGWANAQVVLSRRVYAEHGRTWQQLWISDPGGTNFRQLTRSARDHSEPACSRDGKTIYFVSDEDAARSLNVADGTESERELWSFDRRTGVEQKVWSTSEDEGLRLHAVAADGGVLISLKAGLFKVGRNPWHVDNVSGIALSPDGLRVAVMTAGPSLFITDSATGKSRLPVGNYDSAVWSPSGRRLASTSGQDIAIVDAVTGKEIEHVRFSQRESEPEGLVWSPDESSLLVGTYGESAGSGDPQLDYFLLNLAGKMAAKTWTRELTAQEVLWLPGGKTVLYTKPIGLTPLALGSRHSVWTVQLARYDLATQRDSVLTSGLVKSGDLAFCGR
jgi:Tol biopolymer transport system component